MALPALPLFCCWKIWGDSALGTFSFLRLASVYSISTHLLSLTAPWSLFLAFPSLRPHTHAVSCQPGISAGLAHLIHASVSWSLVCERLWLGSRCSLSLRMQLLLLHRPLRCTVWLGLRLPLCRVDGVVLYSLSLYIHSVKKKVKKIKLNLISTDTWYVHLYISHFRAPSPGNLRLLGDFPLD